MRTDDQLILPTMEDPNAFRLKEDRVWPIAVSVQEAAEPTETTNDDHPALPLD